MPPSSDQPASQEHPTVDPSLLYQEEATRRRSPGRKGKKSKKYETKGEDAEKERSPRGLPREMTSPSSILSQLHASTSPPPPPPPPPPPNGFSSPLLEAWDPPPHAHHTSFPAQATNDLVGNNTFSRSPPQTHGNGVSIAGSPPQHQVFADEFRGGFLRTSPPISPRAAYRQPINRNNEYQSFGDYLGSSPGSRRSPSAQARYSHYPLPPHQPQAHFYGAPDIDFGKNRPDMKYPQPNDGLCYVFDSMGSAGIGVSKRMEDVLLVGGEHCLDVYHVDKSKVERIGRLEGLRGLVIGAKMLPSPTKGARAEVQPLVAVIVHGPFIPLSEEPTPGNFDTEAEEFEPSASELRALEETQEPDLTHCQTTVEVYCLHQGKQVATLFRSPKVKISDGPNPTHFARPPPIGDLRIQGKGKFIIISSGISGEVYIFESVHDGKAAIPLGFHCIGKVWTRTPPKHAKHSRSLSSSSHDLRPGGSLDLPIVNSQPETAIVALSNRWLALVPPPSSTQSTLHGQVEVNPLGHKAPGVSSHTAPSEPAINCDLDTPKDGSVMNKVARDLTQGAIKGAQWMATEGMQVWNNYWSKPSEQQRHSVAGNPPNQGLPASMPAQHFPPTHAQDNTVDRSKNQPTLVSIVDLEKLSQSQHLKPAVALQPLATFSLPLGCSLVSFSPSGLNLLTASAKGDDQHVWDLMRMIHGEAGRSGDHAAPSKGPSVRQVARISRMTEARIIDVVWTEPGGERLAIITERGTVHVNDLPGSAFRWPPPKLRQRSVQSPRISSAPDKEDADQARPESAGSTFSSALGMFAGKTQPLLAAVRGRSPSSSSGFSGFGSLAMTAGVGAKGGKAVVAGVNRSVSAAAAGTVSTIRHLGENRLTLPVSSSSPAPGRVQWLSGRHQARIAVTGAGVVRIYSIRQSSDPKAGHGRPAVVGNKPAEFSLSKPSAESSTYPGSFWRMQPSGVPRQTPSSDTHPLSHAEIDTCNSYQPFHSDRHVNLHVYEEDVDHHLHDTDPWVFGEAIPATKVSVGSISHKVDDDANSKHVLPSQMEKVINIDGEIGEGQQFVITTRPKRNKNGDEDEIFEDDLQILEFAEGRV